MMHSNLRNEWKAVRKTMIKRGTTPAEEGNAAGRAEMSITRLAAAVLIHRPDAAAKLACYCSSLPGTPCDFCSGIRTITEQVVIDALRYLTS